MTMTAKTIRDLKVGDTVFMDCMVGYERYFKRRPEDAGSAATIEMPFVCDHCKHTRYSLEMIGGDGDLICSPCFESYVSALGG